MTQAEALNIMKTGANVFLTGEPGSGKTHTVNAYVDYLHEHGIDPAITASTGIAATHIHGQTIHSWSGIGIKGMLTPYDIDHIASTEYLSRRIRKTTVLIIDEISMIEANTLDMVDMVCREVRQSEEPFGGLQVILVGDFFQLPPVTKGGTAPRFAFQSAVWQTMKPLVCYLSEQHRQADERLLSLLAAIRTNEVMDDHLSYLHDRIASEGDIYDDPDITKLFPHNVDVDGLNDRAIASLEGTSMRYDMTEQGKESLVAGLKKGCLSPETLILKIGAVVMCTKNNQQKGYANGTIGTVMRFESDTKYPVIRTRYGDEITIEPSDWSIEENGKVKARITQLPLRLAWAITVHKSQGMSLDAAVMDLREVFEYGQGYVALSRVRTLKGLYLLGFNERAFMVHPVILEADAGMRKLSREAQSVFMDIEKGELQAMHDRFILAAGGTVAKRKKTSEGKLEKIKRDTTDITYDMVKEGKSILEIAKARKMVWTTIIGHIEKLVEAGKLTWTDVSQYFSPDLLEALPEIEQAFLVTDSAMLTPVREKLNGKYSFDTLRLARIALKLQK